MKSLYFFFFPVHYPVLLITFPQYDFGGLDRIKMALKAWLFRILKMGAV